MTVVYNDCKDITITNVVSIESYKNTFRLRVIGGSTIDIPSREHLVKVNV